MAMWNGYSTYAEMVAAKNPYASQSSTSSSSGSSMYQSAQAPAPSLFSNPPASTGFGSIGNPNGISLSQSAGTGVLHGLDGSLASSLTPASQAAAAPIKVTQTINGVPDPAYNPNATPTPAPAPAPYGTNAFGQPLTASSPYATQPAAPTAPPAPLPQPPGQAPLTPAPSSPQAPAAPLTPQSPLAPSETHPLTTSPVTPSNAQSIQEALLGQITGSVMQDSPMQSLIQQLAQQAMQLAKQPSQVGNYTQQVQSLMNSLNQGYNNNDYVKMVQQAAESARTASYDAMNKQYQERMAGQGLTGTDGSSLKLFSELQNPIEKQLLAQRDSDLVDAQAKHDGLGQSLISGYGDLMKNEGLAGQLDTQRLASLSDLAGNLGQVAYQPTQARIAALQALLSNQTTNNDLAYKSAMLGNQLQNSTLDRQLQQQQLTQSASDYQLRLQQMQQQLDQSRQQSALQLQQAQQSADQYSSVTKPASLLELQQAQTAAHNQAQLTPLQQQLAIKQAQQALSSFGGGGGAAGSSSLGNIPSGSAAGFAGLNSGGVAGGVSGLSTAGAVQSQVGGGGMYSAQANAEAARLAAAQAAAHPANVQVNGSRGGGISPTTDNAALQIGGIGQGLSTMAGQPVAQGGAAAWQNAPSLFDYSSSAYYNPASNPYSSTFNSMFDAGGVEALKGL